MFLCVYSGWLSFLPTTRLPLPMLTVETHAWILHQQHTRQIYHGNVYLQAQCFRVASICQRNNYYKHWSTGSGPFFPYFLYTLQRFHYVFFENDTMLRNCQKPNRLLRNELYTCPFPPLPLTPQPFSKYSCSTRSDGASVSLVVLVQENYRLFHWKYCDRQHCKCNFHLWYIRTHKYRIWRSVSFSVSFAICHSTALQSQSMKEMLCIAPQ